MIPVFEEHESTYQLIAKELGDREGRLELLNDPHFIAQFKCDWTVSESGWNLPHLLSKLGLLLETFSRELVDIVAGRCPLEHWHEESLDKSCARYMQYQNDKTVAINELEADFCE
ncbi:MAG: hypothetical protein ACI90U_001115 [Pseudomonadales bacterium]